MMAVMGNALRLSGANGEGTIGASVILCRLSKKETTSASPHATHIAEAGINRRAIHYHGARLPAAGWIHFERTTIVHL